MDDLSQRQIKLVVVGHVDYGKSTLLGRMLLDRQRVADDKLEKLQRICREGQFGFEPAFLFDAFAEEREQGVTINSTRAEFELDGIRYILIDAPGHVEFLKHMLSASSDADYGILLLDAGEGLCEQTKLQAKLLKVVGINEVIIVINKMDTVNYQEMSFNLLHDSVTKFLNQSGLHNLFAIPANALEGEGVTRPATSMPWYCGPTVLQALGQLATGNMMRKGKNDTGALRMPLQDVYKFDHERLFVGRLFGGRLDRGERILFSPSNKAATVKAIKTYDNLSIDSCGHGDSVALLLEEPIYVERGELITRPSEAPEVADQIHVTLAWISREPFRPNSRYLLKLGTFEMSCQVKLNNVLYDQIPLTNGAIEEATLICERRVAFDPPTKHSNGTNFVLCTEEGTVAAGSITGAGMSNFRSPALIEPEAGFVSREEIEVKQGHGSLVLWLTGVPASGKTTIARAVQRKLFAQEVRTVVLDGDNIRGGVCQDLGFSAEDRSENVRRIAHIARLFLDCGYVVLVACVSPYVRDRERARQIIGSDKFKEIYISCSLSVCQERDPKGFYKRNVARELKGLTGYDDPYQPPTAPDLMLDTTQLSLEDEVKKLMTMIDRDLTFNFAPISAADDTTLNVSESISPVFSV